MDELIQQLQAKTGLGVDQIKSVLSGVRDFLGDKLPGPVADQINKYLGDEGGAATAEPDGGDDLMDQAKDMLGGFLDGDKK